MAGNPTPVHIPQHEVQPFYRRHLEKERAGMKAKHPKYPFGSYQDRDPQTWRPKRGWKPTAKPKRLPIQGPPNWQQIWQGWGSAGEEYKKAPLPDDPLPLQQMDFVKNYKGLYENIKFGDLLGTGGFGKVWKVECREKGKPLTLACKIIPLQRSGTLLESVDDMLADMSALRYLKHKNICGILYMISIPDTKTGFPYSRALFFSELCGGDLFTIIEHWEKYKLGFLPEPTAKIWFRQVCRGLQYLHRQKVAHMDMKIENVLFQSKTRGFKITPNMDWNVFLKAVNKMTFKLADFGLAISYGPEDDMVTDDRNIGTFEFMAPELKQPYGTGAISTTACDIYSLGLALADCVLGDQEFNKAPARHRYIMLVSSQGRSTAMPRFMADLLFHALDPDPTDRYTVDALMAHEWLRK